EDIWYCLTRDLLGSGTKKEGESKQREEGADGRPDLEEADSVVKLVNAIESFALCVGMPGAGKSSLLQMYLNPNKNDTPRPTVALEYMFARRATTANAPKDIAHIWELGGGSHVSDLVRVPITTARFRNALYIIVVDLSKPSSVIPHLLHWTDQIKARAFDHACVKVCVRELSKKDPTFADNLKRKTYAKLGRDHPDLKTVKPCPVPLIIIANKYDIFKNQESGRRRALAQALRFVAHLNGASLLFSSTKEKQLRDIFRLTLNKHMFQAAGRHALETNPERALAVPAGSDKFEAILKTTPDGFRQSDFISGGGHGVTEGAMESWKRAVLDAFGPPAPSDKLNLPQEEGEDGEASGGNGRVVNRFPEPTVDECRAQRDTELQRYRKETERKAKMDRRAS
ncbi:unnamed protein product, partial [Discosporangium mesarthrocarpum]